MDDHGGPHLWGRERRYMLTELLWERGPMTVAELAQTLAAEGWCVGGRPSKTISDALRWEIAHRRVVRLGRGRYGPGRMPKQTQSWIRCRNRRTREEARERLADARHAAEHPSSAGTLLTTGMRSVTHPTAPSGPGSAVHHPATDADPARPRARPPSRPPNGHEDDVEILGAGWSEEEDAAEDEALRRRLLGELTIQPDGLSGGAT